MKKLVRLCLPHHEIGWFLQENGEEFEILANPVNCGVYHLPLVNGRYQMPNVPKYPNYNHPYQYA